MIDMPSEIPFLYSLCFSVTNNEGILVRLQLLIVSVLSVEFRTQALFSETQWVSNGNLTVEKCENNIA